MENIYITGLVISFTFLISKFLEMRFITKENKPLKNIITDSIFVYFSVVIGYYIIEQFNLKTQILNEAPIYIDRTGF